MFSLLVCTLHSYPMDIARAFLFIQTCREYPILGTRMFLPPLHYCFHPNPPWFHHIREAKPYHPPLTLWGATYPSRRCVPVRRQSRFPRWVPWSCPWANTDPKLFAIPWELVGPRHGHQEEPMFGKGPAAGRTKKGSSDVCVNVCAVSTGWILWIFDCLASNIVPTTIHAIN